jgi:hypothetical protein
MSIAGDYGLQLYHSAPFFWTSQADCRLPKHVSVQTCSQEEEDVPQEGAVAVYDTEQEIAANDVARKQHSAVFLAANQKNLPSSWLKMNGSTCW